MIELIYTDKIMNIVLNKRKSLLYGLLCAAPPMLFLASLIVTAKINPALVAYMGLILGVIIGVIALIALAALACCGSSRNGSNCFLIGCCVGGGKSDGIIALIVASVFVLAICVIFGTFISGIAGICFGLFKLAQNEKLKSIGISLNAFALIGLFAIPITIAIINPEIGKYVFTIDNFDPSKIADQIDPKTSAILISCILVSFVLCIASFVICKYKLDLFGDKEIEYESHHSVREFFKDLFTNTNSTRNLNIQTHQQQNFGRNPGYSTKQGEYTGSNGNKYKARTKASEESLPPYDESYYYHNTRGEFIGNVRTTIGYGTSEQLASAKGLDSPPPYSPQ